MKRRGRKSPPPPVRAHERALVGVSGGRDSVALLHWLLDAGSQELIVCHLDHGLRAESAAEAEFVQQLCRELRLEVVVERTDLRGRRSLEAASREARYTFFSRVARERELPRVILAHHADDQVETFLLKLFRGAGGSGLAAMRPISMREIDGIQLEIHRPLLGVWREEIDAFVQERALSYCEDASNADRRHLRNRVRHEVIPSLCTSLGRDVRRALWRAAEVLGAEDEFLNGMLLREDVAPELSTAALQPLPEALQRRVIQAWLRANGVTDISFDDVEAVRSLLTGRGAKVNLAGDRHARRRAGRLFLDPSTARSFPD